MADVRMYPQGRAATAAQPRAVANLSALAASDVETVRFRFTIAQVNAGQVVLPALSGVRWQILDWIMIAIGGNAGGATGVWLDGTQAGTVVHLAATTVGAMTRSTICRAGIANAVVLADGAGFAPCDANTSVKFIKNGNDLTTATHIDLILTYVAVRG